MEKSPEAFRTISEVADSIDLPQHVLRFWETRFPQIRPLKRAGGRRYYRPEDIERLRLIKRLLYDEGYTIKGVQKLFKQQGVQVLTDGKFEPRLAFAAGEPIAQQRGEVPTIGSRPGPPRAEPPASQVEPPVPRVETLMETPRGAILSADLASLRAALDELAQVARILDQARARDA
jgi:DNA-binding transcriptional MerR regulator